MPKLPEIPKTSPELRVARVLARRSVTNDLPVFGSAVLRWIEHDPELRAKFIKWYEAQPVVSERTALTDGKAVK